VNTVTIHGTVGKEPEMKVSNGGTSMLTFSVADNYGKDDKKKTTWHNILVFGNLADNVANTLNKGDSVLIVGRIEEEEFTKKDGTKGYARKVIAEEVGASCRWSAWVKDQSDKVVARTGMVGRNMNSPMLGDEEPF